MMVSTAGRHYHVPRLVSVSQQQCFFFLNLFREKTERFIHQSEASVHPKAGLIIRSSYRIIPLVFESSFYCNSAVNQMNGAADRRLNSINLPPKCFHTSKRSYRLYIVVLEQQHGRQLQKHKRQDVTKLAGCGTRQVGTGEKFVLVIKEIRN